MKSVRMLQDVVGGEGESLKEGSSYSLNDASAMHWLKRGMAVEVQETEVVTEDQKSPVKRGPKGK
jgi:hypothetical protein